MASALHPQTFLCDTMNGQPLTREHGAPLRLYLAVKYGYKSDGEASLECKNGGSYDDQPTCAQASQN